MSAKLENEASSATLVAPLPSSPSDRHDIPEVPPLPVRAEGLIISHTRGASETDKEQSMIATAPASLLSASFDPNTPTGFLSTLSTPHSSSYTAPPLPDLVPPRPPSQQSEPRPEHSPFSSSFDPNPGHSHITRASQQHALHSRLSASSFASSAGSIHVAQEQWNHIMSTSLNALASQFQAASRAMTSSGSVGTYASQHLHDASSASYRTSESGDPGGAGDSVSELALSRTAVNTQGVEMMLSLMMSRLENAERNQVRMYEQLEHVRKAVMDLKNPVSSDVAPVEKDTDYLGDQRREKVRRNTPEITIASNKEPKSQTEEDWKKRVEALEARVNAITETIKLEQARLYPRLQNAVVTLNKQSIKPVPQHGTGRAPTNFPATKGEFEHLTKERYELLLKSYELPVQGDTAAKREAVREFIGLTPPGR